MDTLNLANSNSPIFSKDEPFKFFMIDNITSGIKNEKTAADFKSDGLLGLSPKISSPPAETFGQYLKRRKLIPSDSLSVEQITSSSTPKFMITLGKYNETGSPSTKLELRPLYDKDNMWAAKTTGFSIDSKKQEALSDSYVIFEVTKGISSFTTQDEARFNKTMKFYDD